MARYCKDCKFWVVPAAGVEGECHKSPPQLGQRGWRGGWPQVNPGGWCGEWKRKPKTAETAE